MFDQDNAPIQAPYSLSSLRLSLRMQWRPLHLWTCLAYTIVMAGPIVTEAPLSTSLVIRDYNVRSDQDSGSPSYSQSDLPPNVYPFEGTTLTEA